MSSSFSRRYFIAGLGAVAAASVLPADSLAGGLQQMPLSSATNLSYLKKSITLAPAQVTFGYASITWGGNDMQAIKDVAELGFKGIQLRSNIVPEYASKPKALRDMLVQHKLEMVALSSGGVQLAPEREKEEIEKHARHGAFVRDVGGRYLQVTDGFARRKTTPVADDYKRLGRLMTEIGKRTAEIGIPLGYHNHMNNLGETPEDVERLMNESDPRYVKLELDIAHYFQGGGDPAKAARQYKDRLLFLHIKDVEGPLAGATGDPRFSYRFVELGRGKVDLPAFFAALKEIEFRGWAVVELDSVPDKTRTPKEAGMISKRYLEEKLMMKV
ncbi:MAG: sugar phosphate isomerase/epimerase [Acidobacteriota bacterium]|nr:sugar phosphate isomerase/epimerase [Acidobacteriota bacterium]